MAKKPPILDRTARPRVPNVPQSLLERATKAAVRLLKYKDRTRHELVARLSERYGDPLAREAVDALEAAGLTGDQRVAREYARQRLTGKLESAAMVERTLGRRGVSRPQARAAVADATEGRPDFDRARDLLARSAHRLPKDNPVAARRRAFGLLARRGFDEETAARAVDAVLGEWREDASRESERDADV